MARSLPAVLLLCLACGTSAFVVAPACAPARRLTSRPIAVVALAERIRKRDRARALLNRVLGRKPSEPAAAPEAAAEAAPSPVVEVEASPPPVAPPAPPPVVEVPPSPPPVAAAPPPPPAPPPPAPAPPPPAPAKPKSDDSVEKETVIARPAADVFDAVTDFDKYPLWVTGLKQITDETPPGSDKKRIKFDAGTMGLTISYTLEYTIVGEELMSWVSVAGGVKSIIGSYQLTPIDETSTQVNYRLEVDAGFGVPGPVRRAVTKLVVGAALPELKRYLENKYQKA